MLMTPGGKSVSSAMTLPTNAAHHGVSGAGLSTTVKTGRQGGADLREVDLVREVPRGDGADHPDRLVPDFAGVLEAHRFRLAEIGGPLVGLGQVGEVAEIVDGAGELGSGGQEGRATDLGDGEFAELVAVGEQRIAKLTQTARAEPVVA